MSGLGCAPPGREPPRGGPGRDGALRPCHRGLRHLLGVGRRARHRRLGRGGRHLQAHLQGREVGCGLLRLDIPVISCDLKLFLTLCRYLSRYCFILVFVYCVDVTNIKNSKWYKEDMPFRNNI